MSQLSRKTKDLGSSFDPFIISTHTFVLKAIKWRHSFLHQGFLSIYRLCFFLCHVVALSNQCTFRRHPHALSPLLLLRFMINKTSGSVKRAMSQLNWGYYFLGYYHSSLILNCGYCFVIAIVL